jgi:aminomethyltransferase
MPLETPLLNLYRAADAEIGEYFGTLLPSRLGEFAAEYSAAREAVALVDTNFRAFFKFSGPDAQRYVNAVLTSNVRDLNPGQGAVGLFLTPQGHILDEIETLLLDGSILAVSHAMARERTYSTFDKFIIMDDVTLEDQTSTTGSLDLVGPRAADLISELSGANLAEMPEMSHVEITLGSIPSQIGRTFRGHADRPQRTARAPLAADGSSRPRKRRSGRWHGSDQLDSPRMRDAMVWKRLRRKEYST